MFQPVLLVPCVGSARTARLGTAAAFTTRWRHCSRARPRWVWVTRGFVRGWRPSRDVPLDAMLTEDVAWERDA
jgi:hypothetical protein